MQNSLHRKLKCAYMRTGNFLKQDAPACVVSHAVRFCLLLLNVFYVFGGIKATVFKLFTPPPHSHLTIRHLRPAASRVRQDMLQTRSIFISHISCMHGLYPCVQLFCIIIYLRLTNSNNYEQLSSLQKRMTRI
jgi:hypothetical protein